DPRRPPWQPESPTTRGHSRRSRNWWIEHRLVVDEHDWGGDVGASLKTEPERRGRKICPESRYAKNETRSILQRTLLVQQLSIGRKSHRVHTSVAHYVGNL